jgi:hypothetical protein
MIYLVIGAPMVLKVEDSAEGCVLDTLDGWLISGLFNDALSTALFILLWL